MRASDQPRPDGTRKRNRPALDGPSALQRVFDPQLLEGRSPEGQAPLINQYRPPLASSVEVPHLGDSDMDARFTYADPVVRVRCERVDDVVI